MKRPKHDKSIFRFRFCICLTRQIWRPSSFTPSIIFTHSDCLSTGFLKYPPVADPNLIPLLMSYYGNSSIPFPTFLALTALQLSARMIRQTLALTRCARSLSHLNNSASSSQMLMSISAHIAHPLPVSFGAGPLPLRSLRFPFRFRRGACASTNMLSRADLSTLTRNAGLPYVGLGF